MLVSRDLLKNAIKHFPRWMDIRKRYFSSVGGKLLSSIADETELIQEEIDKYVQEFFIPFYEDKCEIIPDFIYKANVGSIDINDFNLISPELELTDNIRTFYESVNCAYYQDGFIFVRNNTDIILYSVEGYKMEAKLEKMHVWNAYDEFATFIGIERYENETNAELYNRIIATSRKVLNSTEQGIKDAITASLINIIPELSIENIKLERPTAENLVKYYDSFGSVLEKLIHVNKDVLRVKSWDIDKWSNDFKHIDYIPHVWDIILDEYVNGIGDNDDLKTVLIDSTNSTDIELSFYEKSEESIDKYIKDKNIDENINLSLIKYNNILDPYEAKYKITAGEAIDIQDVEENTSIMAIAYETSNGEKYRKIDDIGMQFHNIEVQKSGLMKEGKYYRVRFTPKSKYDSMEIYECEIEDEYGSPIVNEGGEILDFKREKEDFILDGNTLINKYVKKSINKKSQFSITDNVIDTGSGVTIDKINKDAKMTLNVDGCNGQSVKIIYDCEMSNILEHEISLNNFFYDKESQMYLSDNTVNEKSITINIKANQFQASIVRGQCNITAIVNGKPIYNGAPLYTDGNAYFKTNKYSIPQNMQIIITALGTNQVAINELLYNNYDMIITSQDGDLSADNSEEGLYWLPPQYENNLNIVMRSRTQYAPTIRRIFIGRLLDEGDAYETDLMVGAANCKLSINSNCNVELYESDEPFASCDKYNDKLTVITNYSTDNLYVATENDSYITLDMSEYISINSIKADEGTYERTEIGKQQSHVLRLKKGQSVSGVTIDGYYDTIIDIKTIHELIQNECAGYYPSVKNDDGIWIEGDKLYVSKLLKCFIVERINGEQVKANITLNSFNLSNASSVSKIEIINMPECLEAAFVSTNGLSESESVLIGSSYQGSFDNFYIYPKHSKEYIAKNEYVTYTKEKSGIEIINTFNNGYIDNMLMAYKVEAMSTIEDEFDVTFDNDLNWSIGKKDIKIRINKDNSFNATKKIITERVKLGSTINLKESYITENKEQIELAQYIIDTNGTDYEVIYKYDINNPTYEKAEFIDIKNDGFNKLRYSNIVEIKYIGKDVFSEDETLEEIDPSTYELDKEKGIIKWKDKDLINSGERLYIIYIIKKAIAIKYNLDSLYNKIQFPISAYKKVASFEINDIENSKKIDLTNPILGDKELSDKICKAYKSSDIIYVTCKEPGFEAEKIDNMLIIKKIAEVNSLAIKSGWYYMFGKEYYMFATDQTENIVEDEYITFQEVSKVDSELFLHKETSNMIRNSKMILGTLSNSYHVNDFSKLKLKGSSDINSITACDNYNNWHTFGMNISLREGLNGLGLFFEPYEKRDIGYAFLDITKYLSDKSHISFYNPDKLNVYIGKETLINDISLNDTTNITALMEIISDGGDNIQYAILEKENNCKYYLVVRGRGVLDDIVIQDGNNPDLNLHTKNISILNLEMSEAITNGVVTRMFLDNTKGNKNNGAEINSEGYIVNASNIDWNVTKIKSYTNKKDWLSGCELTNVDIVNINDTDCAAMTTTAAGKIITRPIYVGDPNTINSIIFKVNNMPLKEMTGFKIQLSQAQTANGSFIPCKQKLNNNSSLNYTKDLIYSYIQLSVEMQQKKVIDNIEIYVEHKSTDRFAPTERIESNGQFITKILDARYSADYKLKSIEIEDIQGDVSLSIRAAKEKSMTNVWTDWHTIDIKDGVITNDIVFEDFRFFQLRASLNGKTSKIKIKHFELEVIK